MSKCWDTLHMLSGAIWRLEKYGYIQFECPDEEEGQMNHWIAVMHKAIDESRDMAKDNN